MTLGAHLRVDEVVRPLGAYCALDLVGCSPEWPFLKPAFSWAEGETEAKLGLYWPVHRFRWVPRLRREAKLGIDWPVCQFPGIPRPRSWTFAKGTVVPL